MENKIQRLIVKYDDVAQYIVVVRENDIEEYLSFSDRKEFRTIYSNLIQELKNNNSELDGIADPALVVKKLREMRLVKLLREKEDLILNVLKYDDNFSVRYASGKVLEVEDMEEYTKYINMLEAQYEMYSAELEKLGIIENKVSEKASEEVFEEETKKEEQTEEENESNKSKIRITKKLVSLVLAGAVLVSVGYGLANLKNKKNTSGKQNNQTYSEEMAAENAYNITATPTPMPSPTPIIISTPNNSDLDPNLTYPQREYDQESDEIAVEIIKDGDNKYLMSHNLSDGDYNIENLSQISFGNFQELGSHIQNSESNPSLETTGTLINFDKLFENPIDRAYVMHFAKNRNEIISQAYEEGNMDLARQFINLGNYDIVKYVGYNEPLEVQINGETLNIYYSDLSYEAKEAILYISQAVQVALANDNFEYNGEIFYQNNVGEIINNMYADLLNSKRK